MTILEELKNSLASIETNLKQAQANYDAAEPSKDNYVQFDQYYHAIDRIYAYLYDLEENVVKMLRTHLQGHLPPINGPGQMSKALSVLGLSEDYEVQKKLVYASKNKNYTELTINP